VDGRNVTVPILPKERDPRLITIRRGGTLTDEHHRLLADWALSCAEHVLHLFEDHQPGDSRPRDAIDVGRAWYEMAVASRRGYEDVRNAPDESLVWFENQADALVPALQCLAWPYRKRRGYRTRWEEFD
jgi:hypothetical protein